MNTLNNEDIYTLPSVAFLGRTLEEYCLLFGMEPRLLAGQSMLDVSSGPSSFAAEALAHDITVTAFDPLYTRSLEALTRLGRADLGEVMSQSEQAAQHFNFRVYKDFREVREKRRKALETFLADYPIGRAAGRYVAGTLPDIEFPDASFDRVLNSHFLFLYGNRLGRAFIEAALRELMRLARFEVRVFPLIQLNGERYPIETLVDLVHACGFQMHTQAVSMVFFKGSNECLFLTRK